MVHVDFDQILDDIGPFGPYQIYNTILIGLAGLPAGANSLANVFLAGLPNFQCNLPAGNDTGIHAIENDVCYYEGLNGTEACTEWQFENDVYDNTMATEWDLVCGKEWLLALSQSLYMLGFLIGCVGFGNLSDMVGRKKAWYVSLILMIFSGSAAAFMPNYWLFVSFRLITGAASSGVFTCGFVITMETIGISYRMVPGIFYQGWFAAGYMGLALVAYFIRDYRYLQLFLGLIPMIFLPYWCLIGESPRWLLAESRTKEATREIKKAARMNKQPLPDILQSHENKSLMGSTEKYETQDSKTYTIIDLLRTPNMRRKTINSSFNWLVNSMVYYGLSLGAGDLAGGPYLNLFLSGLMEFPGFVIACLTLDRIGRRFPLAGLMGVGGLACLGVAFTPEEYNIIRTTLAMIGKLGISGSFAVIYVFSAELFPTVVRNMGVGAGSMCARIGGLCAPFIMLLGLWWKPLPMVIFGCASVIAGLFAILLPETLNESLPDSMEDGELFGMDAHKNIFSVFKSKSGAVPQEGDASQLQTMA